MLALRLILLLLLFAPLNRHLARDRRDRNWEQRKKEREKNRKRDEEKKTGKVRKEEESRFEGDV